MSVQTSERVYEAVEALLARGEIVCVLGPSAGAGVGEFLWLKIKIINSDSFQVPLIENENASRMPKFPHRPGKRQISQRKSWEIWKNADLESGAILIVKSGKGINNPKGPPNYFASFLTSNFSDSFLDNPNPTLVFMVFGSGGRDHDSQNYF